MQTATLGPLVDVVDTFTAERSYSSGVIRPLTVCAVERWGLRTECQTPDDPFVEREANWLLPDAGLRLTQQHPRSRHAKAGPTVLTAVRIQRDTRAWRTTDLLLGLEIPGGTTARFFGADEYATAVAGRVIGATDASAALHAVHRAFEELSYCHHNVRIWLARQGIVDAWPPR
ncbi:MAG: hypothetical protein J2O49_09330 [Sciscionella sp.]|nr:hypothetical protein [Sciscionella sp.]